MNESCRSARDVSEPKSPWLRTGFLMIMSLLTALSAVGAAGPSKQHGSAIGDTSHSLNLAAALEASQGTAHSLGNTGVLTELELSVTGIGEDQPRAPLPAITLDWPNSRLSRPLDQDLLVPKLFRSQPDGGLSKNRWGIRWRLSLVESADLDGQV